MALSNPSRSLRFPDLKHAHASPPPSIMYAEGTGNERLFALFNWNEKKDILIDIPKFPAITGGKWKDAWNGEPLQSKTVKLKPGESKLLMDNKKTKDKHVDIITKRSRKTVY